MCLCSISQVRTEENVNAMVAIRNFDVRVMEQTVGSPQARARARANQLHFILRKYNAVFITINFNWISI